MLRTRICILAAALWLCSPIVGAEKHLSSSCEPIDNNADDRATLAWRLFACLNSPKGNQHEQPVVYWETWPSPLDLYCDDKGKSCDPRTKPKRNKWAPGIQLEPIQQELRFLAETPAEISTASKENLKATDSTSSRVDAQEDGQEVRLNDKVFDYVADHALWYLQGQQRAFLKDQISFPAGAIEVKAYWVLVDAAQKTRYLWRRTQDGRFLGLIALSIAAKTQPRWFWATFEHVDNPKRCAYTPCNSKFSTISGANDTIQLGLSAKLLAILQEEGLDTASHQWWLNYRLHDSQTDFDTPRVLGNSVLEARFKDLTSCMTCHSRAARDFEGHPLAITNGAGGGFTGNPVRSWFCDESDKRKVLTLDYVWSLARANPVKGLPPPTLQESPPCGTFEWLPH